MAPLKRKFRLKKRVYKKKTVKKVSLNIKKYIKQVIAKDIENKQVDSQTYTSFGSILNDPFLDIRPILPYTGYISIPQGVLQNNRIGNVVKTKKVYLNYALYPLPYDAISNVNTIPFIVQLFLGNVKQYRGVLPQATDINLLFQSGSTALAPTSTLIDLCSTINYDNWDIKKMWTHKLGFSSNNGTGVSAAYQGFTNNDFKLSVVKRMDITRFCPVNMKFNDASSTTTGNNLFFFFQAIPANGSAYIATQLPARIQYNIVIEYEDA